jgi:hypothetical protein
MSRRRFNEEEMQELRRGLLLRMQELLEEGKDLHAAPYSLDLSPGRRVGLTRSRWIGISSSM